MMGISSLVPWTKEDVKKRFLGEPSAPTLPTLVFGPKPEANESTSMRELQAVGSIKFFHEHFDPKNRTALVGLGIWDKSNRGKGYGREVLTWMLEYGFMELNLHRVELEVYSFNKSAAEMYRKVYVLHACLLSLQRC